MILLLVEVTQSCMIKIIVDATAHWKWYIGPAEEITVYSLITDFLKFMILYNYLVPISLYVTIGKNYFFVNLFYPSMCCSLSYLFENCSTISKHSSPSLRRHLCPSIKSTESSIERV